MSREAGIFSGSCCLSSASTHEIYLHVPGRRSPEFPEGDHWDAGKDAPGLWPGAMLPVPSLCLLRSQQTVHRGRPHVEECGTQGVREHGTASLQGLQEIRHRCLQPPPAEFPSKVVHPDERLHHDRTKHVLSLSAPGRGSRGDQRRASQDHPLCIGAEQVCCVGRAVPRGGMPCAGTSF